MSKFTALSLIFVTLACYTTYTQACSCFPGHLQNFVCDPHYFNVVSTDEPNNKVREITVDVLKDFKKYVEGDRVILTTAEHSATCGVSLSDDSCYVVAGTFEEGNPLRYRINTCGFYIKCSAITDLQWRGLKRGYGKACSSNCKVLNPYEDENATGCRMNPKQNDILCLQNYGICQRCDRRRCNRRRLRCWWRIARNPNRRCTRN